MSPLCSSGWKRYRGRSALAAVALLLAVPAAAPAADPEFRATVSPDRVVWSQTTELTYRVEATTGEQPERFDLVAGARGAFVGFDGQAHGSLLIPSGDGASLEGPGSLRVGFSSHGDPIPCPGSGLPQRHGGLFYEQTFELRLPARSTSTLVFRASVVRDAPWPRDSYAAVLRAANPFEEGTLASPVDIPVAAPEPGGRTGVRLAIATDPASAECATPPRIDGRPITVSGRSDPPLAGQRVRLHYVPPGQRSPVTLADVPVRDDGTFEYRNWRPRDPGVYEVAATYVSQRPELTDDFSAPRLFEVGVPAGEDPPPPLSPPYDPAPPMEEDGGYGPALAASIVSRRLGLDRRGRARVRVACPALSGASCAGTVRLVWRRRVLARRRTVVPPGTRADVVLRVRLGPRARRVLRRRGRLVVAADAGGVARRVMLRR